MQTAHLLNRSTENNHVKCGEKKIEAEVAALSETELRTFRSWFIKFDAARWDEQFTHDVQAGKLNELAAEALEQYGRGQCKRL